MTDTVRKTDQQSGFVFISPQAEKIPGYKPDELTGHTPFEYIHPDIIEKNRLAFRAGVKEKTGVVIHKSHRIHKNGNLVVLESHATPTYHNDGSFAGFRGIGRDITDLNR